MLIDTHAHVNFSAFKDDADEVIRRALEKNVWLVNVGSQYSTSQRAVEYAGKYSIGVFAAVGLHPIQLKKRTIEYQDDEELTPEEIKTTGENLDYAKYFELAKHPKVVAIGEMGLDYHHFEPGDNVEELKSKQKGVLLQGIRLANEVQKPMMIHCWGVKSRQERDHARTDAYDDLLDILQDNPVEKKGVIHSFVGGYKTAKKFIELGFKIGMNGVITYGIGYDRLIKEIDLEDMVLETDCPYLTPVPHKGERNEPILVELVAQKIAEVKNISIDEVAEVTTKNAKELFGI
ncbi:TatD family deoxyribonuclease [Patescibacteria group bacterium]|nr:MAG: TatD family deoxyribonuclease [Patescibacteria group bacterium]